MSRFICTGARALTLRSTRTCLLVTFTVLSAASVAFSQQTEFNQTENTTCERKDPFDEYVYHAPMIEGIVIDGDPSDWEQYPLLQWAPINHFCEGTGQEGWSTENGGWNWPPSGPEDIAVQFKAGWGVVDNWPMLYLLVEWIDDVIKPPFEGGRWGSTDMLQFWYGEALYNLDPPVWSDAPWFVGIVQTPPAVVRQMNLLLFQEPKQGIRLFRYEANEEGSHYWLDPKQPLSEGEIRQVSNTRAYIECQVMLFQDYISETPWAMSPGTSRLGFGFVGVCDYDVYDDRETFTWLTWGLSNCEGYRDDGRVTMSTIGFERSYHEVFGISPVTAVESSTWGAIKSSF